jgi:hypothetical protein
MASTSFIPPQHPTSHHHSNDLTDSAESAEMVSQWPVIDPDHNANKDSDWEIVSPSSEDVNTAPVVTFDAEALKPRKNPKILHHAQSSPDLRALHAHDDSENDEETSSTVLVEDETSTAYSMVSDPPSVWSVGSNKLSFKDAILQKPAAPQGGTNGGSPGPKKPKKAFKPKFVIVKPSSQKAVAMKRPKSMGNLRALDHIQEDHEDDEVMGDTDANDFYSRKAQGAMGRKNGQKIRPDEAKRLDITMAKKTLQKQRQLNRG